MIGPWKKSLVLKHLTWTDEEFPHIWTALLASCNCDKQFNSKKEPGKNLFESRVYKSTFDPPPSFFGPPNCGCKTEKFFIPSLSLS